MQNLLPTNCVPFISRVLPSEQRHKSMLIVQHVWIELKFNVFHKHNFHFTKSPIIRVVVLLPIRFAGIFFNQSPQPNMAKMRCSCCPFGYHIDLDFINYCKSLGKVQPPSDGQRIRRDRRRQRHSMEIMLGLGPLFTQIENAMEMLPKVGEVRLLYFIITTQLNRPYR